MPSNPDKHQTLSLMVKHLPPSLARLYLLDVSPHSIVDALQVIRPDIVAE